MKKLVKHTKEFLEYILFLVFLNIIKLLGINIASDLCGAIAKHIGPRLRTNKIIINNIKYVYNNLSTEQINELGKEIWNNFGRYIGEFPFVSEETSRIKIENIEIIRDLQKKNTPFIVFSGHFANWDFILPAVLKEIEHTSVVYRKINNRFIDKFVMKKRAEQGTQLICKGPEGIKDLIKTIKTQSFYRF